MWPQCSARRATRVGPHTKFLVCLSLCLPSRSLTSATPSDIRWPATARPAATEAIAGQTPGEAVTAGKLQQRTCLWLIWRPALGRGTKRASTLVASGEAQMARSAGRFCLAKATPTVNKALSKSLNNRVISCPPHWAWAEFVGWRSKGATHRLNLFCAFGPAPCFMRNR